MFLPCTTAELERLGWDAPDVILVSGDAYIDSPFNGIAVIGRTLTAAGFRVAVIPQPDVASLDGIRRLGQPRLFWGVSGGCVDSMVANYTATGKKRHQDDFTPGGVNNVRPDRAVIAYCNLIRRAFKPCRPIVIGGIEASLRRIAHYDYWSDSVRRTILFDAKADVLVYGMGERTVTALARALQEGREWRGLRGICYALPADSGMLPAGALRLPDFATVAAASPEGRAAFLEMYRLFAANQDPHTARPLLQRIDTRCLVHTPPDTPLSSAELDAVHASPFMLDAHPIHASKGKVRALETIRFSLATHRGCYGECNFCSIAVHQGRQVVSRSERSILEEAHRLTRHPAFTGIIQDVGGPTANMYGYECARKSKQGACASKRCLFPSCCPSLKPDHSAQIALLKRLRHLPGVRKVFVASGIRPDLIAADPRHGAAYIDELVAYHVSGQIKLAPEHADERVLRAMGKPGTETLLDFVKQFKAANARHRLKQFLTYYFIVAHPGCGDDDMRALKQFVEQHLHLSPEQVQIFTPTPSTWSTVMYYTGLDPFTGQPIPVTRGLRAKQAQKDILTPRSR
ncbi:MAG TPA: YgiQ family radical SAM protein [Kiritimatiellia bacterium]|nr:YgiQ family radical SAM protein [Kiritimatiellia bacterium]HRU70773.1 YgiQ family radical SAM protein [Kiritimatiellia bacterium]